MSWALTAVQAANEDIAGCHKLSDYAWITSYPEVMTRHKLSTRARSPSVVSEATAEEKLVASSESAAVAFDTTT